MATPITVETYDAETTDILSERLADYDRAVDRAWIGRHISWCLRNGQGVDLKALKDDEVAS
jgi:hypothetical protein